MKKIVFKYTVKIDGEDRPQTHYAFAYTESLARTGLANHLNVEEQKLWLSKKNLPYKVRKAIFDPNNEDYFLSVDIKEKPIEEKTIEERQNQFFDLRGSILKSVRYKIKALVRHDKEILLEYADFNKEYLEKYSGYDKEELVDKFTYGFDAFHNAYKDVRGIIMKEKFENEKFEDGSYILDVLDSLMYSLSYTEEDYQKMKAHVEDVA
jgi:hypothetical protein